MGRGEGQRASQVSQRRGMDQVLGRRGQAVSRRKQARLEDLRQGPLYPPTTIAAPAPLSSPEKMADAIIDEAWRRFQQNEPEQHEAAVAMRAFALPFPTRIDYYHWKKTYLRGQKLDEEKTNLSRFVSRIASAAATLGLDRPAQLDRATNAIGRLRSCYSNTDFEPKQHSARVALREAAHAVASEVEERVWQSYGDDARKEVLGGSGSAKQWRCFIQEAGDWAALAASPELSETDRLRLADRLRGYGHGLASFTGADDAVNQDCQQQGALLQAEADHILSGTSGPGPLSSGDPLRCCQQLHDLADHLDDRRFRTQLAEAQTERRRRLLEPLA